MSLAEAIVYPGLEFATIIRHSEIVCPHDNLFSKMTLLGVFIRSGLSAKGVLGSDAMRTQRPKRLSQPPERYGSVPGIAAVSKAAESPLPNLELSMCLDLSPSGPAGVDGP